MAAKSAKPQAVVKKKVQAYPFDGLIEIAAQKKPITVLFVNRDGLIARVDKVFVRVGEFYKIQFELPVLRQSVYTNVRVMKTYDRALDPKGLSVERMAEFRFDKLTEDHRNSISTFLSTIGQKK